MSDLIEKLESFRANLVAEDMNYRACLMDESISRVKELESANEHCHEAMQKLAERIVDLEAALRTVCPQCDMPLADRTAFEVCICSPDKTFQATPGCQVHTQSDRTAQGRKQA